jgi:hypothetical protein
MRKYFESRELIVLRQNPRVICHFASPSLQMGERSN